MDKRGQLFFLGRLFTWHPSRLFFLGRLFTWHPSRWSTFYDDWLGLEVEDLSSLGLTDVQKNWRKQMRQSQTGTE